ncbi:MAG: NDP-sugar synthase [Deltaproteobacteria bacterium]|nr:NDP-sugar synthase [Deltaproteobacteria bacterium]
MSDAQAMVLAAGLGTRLWPLTADRAKPAVPFIGKPLVVWVLDLLAAHGVTRATLNTHHRPTSIARAIRGVHELELAISHEETILGTAGALAKARDEGLLDRRRTTLIINAKLFTDLDLTSALRAHEQSGAAVTMVLRRNPERAAFREVLVGGDRVIGFGASIEPRGADPLLFTGVHLIDAAVLAAIPAGRECDTIRDVYPPLIAAGRVHAHVDDRGRWWEFSTLARYLDLHRRASAEGLGADVVLGAGASIAEGAEVRSSVLWENATVGEGAVLDQVVVGAEVLIPPGLRLTRAAVICASHAGGAIPQGEIRGDLIVVPIAPA